MSEALASDQKVSWQGANGAAGLTVRRVDPLVDDEQWDADLAECPGASFFHSAAWARTLHSAYGFTPGYFTLRDSGRLRAVLPMMEVDSWLTGRRGVSLPFTDECAPLCADSDAFGHLYRASLDYAKFRGWKHLEYRGGRPLFSGAPPASSSFLDHSLDLRAGETALFAGLDSTARRAVKKAERSNLSIEFSRDLEAVRAFHGLLRKTRKRHGVPPQPFRFFAAIHRHILSQNHGWVVLARAGGVPVAGAVYFRFGKTVIYKYGASDDAFQELRPNNLVMWRAIQRHAQEGFETFDFGRTSLENEGLRRFKLAWGATERRIDYVRADPRTEAFAPAKKPSPAWTVRCLRIFPDPVLRLIGAALYRHAA